MSFLHAAVRNRFLQNLKVDEFSRLPWLFEDNLCPLCSCSDEHYTRQYLAWL